jgi:4-alpha-glucanotransferase
MDNIMPTEMQELMDYVGYFGESKEELVDQIIRVVEGSVADLCMIPLQDWLHLDNTARINHPSTTGKNWTWRVSGDKITGELAEKIRGMTNIYGRKP